MIYCPQCGSAETIGRSFHSPEAWERCRECGFPKEAIDRRAIAYGAKDVEPKPGGTAGILVWPADEERVSLDRISYHPEDDTFSGWSCGRPVPEWTQH
jgi:ribosomal protein L37E